jgi:hypothetical protein
MNARRKRHHDFNERTISMTATFHDYRAYSKSDRHDLGWEASITMPATIAKR